jgi:hypothetical protein
MKLGTELTSETWCWLQQGPEGAGVDLAEGRGDDDGRAVQQGQQQLLDGDVEAHGDAGEDAVAGAHGGVGAAGEGQVQRGGMGDAHGLGRAGGAGGVDEVGESRPA